MKKYFFIVLLFVIFSSTSFYAQGRNQEQDSIEVTVIDSYVTPEKPHTFMLSFFTSSDCKSKVLIDNKYEYPVTENYTVNHNIKIDLTNLNFKTKLIPYVIIVQDSAGHTYHSDNYDFELPGEIKVESESNFLLLCLFGGTVFALPSPVYVSQNSKNYFSLTKEIPIISIRSSRFSYPAGYISAEYSHIFNAPYKNFLRLGYKQIFVVPGIQYISPGIDWFTNFKGFNGASAELSIGWFKLLNTFTVYTRYRFNLAPNHSENNFHEISIGLYSSFFSVYL